MPRSASYLALLGLAAFSLAACGVTEPPAPRAEWGEIEPMIAASIAPTLDAFEGEWTVQVAGPRTGACWGQQTEWGGETTWVERTTGYEQVFAATSSYFDENVDPRITVDNFARAWRDVYPETEFVAHYEGSDYTYGAQAAGLADSDQVLALGGFGVDNWQFTVTVACETPGFRRDGANDTFAQFAPPG